MNCVALSTCKYSSIADWFKSIFQSFIFININGVCVRVHVNQLQFKAMARCLPRDAKAFIFNFPYCHWCTVEKNEANKWRKNRSLVSFFVISFCYCCMSLCLSCKFPSKYMELIVLKLVYTYTYVCDVENQCECFTCLYWWLVDNDLQTY